MAAHLKTNLLVEEKEDFPYHTLWLVEVKHSTITIHHIHPSFLAILPTVIDTEPATAGNSS